MNNQGVQEETQPQKRQGQNIVAQSRSKARESNGEIEAMRTQVRKAFLKIRNKSLAETHVSRTQNMQSTVEEEEEEEEKEEEEEEEKEAQPRSKVQNSKGQIEAMRTQMRKAFFRIRNASLGTPRVTRGEAQVAETTSVRSVTAETPLQRRRRQYREAQARRRARQTEEQIEARRIQERERAFARRLNERLQEEAQADRTTPSAQSVMEETPLQRRRRQDREAQARRRAQESYEQREARRKQNRERAFNRRHNYLVEEAQVKRTATEQRRMISRVADESAQQTIHRRSKAALGKALRRATETPEQTARRRAADAQRHRNRRHRLLMNKLTVDEDENKLLQFDE